MTPSERLELALEWEETFLLLIKIRACKTGPIGHIKRHHAWSDAKYTKITKSNGQQMYTLAVKFRCQEIKISSTDLNDCLREMVDRLLSGPLPDQWTHPHA